MQFHQRLGHPLVRMIEVHGGEGGIRTHVPELPDHPISSRRRYDHFGTSPLNLNQFDEHYSEQFVKKRVCQEPARGHYRLF